MALDFSPQETRVLGVLIEKELSTPDYYPLTLNSLTTGCNQKSNRDPVVDFSQSEAMTALDDLMRRRVAGHVSGAGSRAEKYRHALAEAWGLSKADLSVLAELLLRGPQTVGELRARSSRMYDIGSIEQVEKILESLAGREEPLVSQLPRQAGQKEARFAHLLQGEPVIPEAPAARSVPSGKIESLEEEVAELRERLDDLEAAFNSFRAQFE